MLGHVLWIWKRFGYITFDQFSAYIGRVGDNTLILGTNNNITVRLDPSGGLFIGSGQASLTSTTLSYPIQVAAASDANAIDFW